MGSTNESVYVKGNQTVDAAYNRAYEDAVHEYGHDGYNGTISTGHGFKVFTYTPCTWPEAHAIEHRELDNLNKWEAWGAVPIVDESAVKSRFIERVFRLDTAEIYTEELKKIVVPQLSLKAGEVVDTLEIIEDNVTWKTVVETPEGDRQVVYQIQGVNAPHRYATLAEARAALTKFANAWGKPVKDYKGDMVVPYNQQRPMDASIFGVVDRGQGVPMLNVKTVVKSRSAKFKVKVDTATERKLGGWFFFGWAAI